MDYKKLNQALIQEVQLMRIQLGTYQKELNEMNKQMMHEHWLRVDQEQRFLQILTQNFRDMVLQVKPGTKFINLIGNENDRYDNNDDCSINKRLNSNNILDNLRRSMQLQNARQSVVTKSPLSRRSSIESDAFAKSNETKEIESDLETSTVADAQKSGQQTEESASDIDRSSIVDVEDDNQENAEEQHSLVEEVDYTDDEDKENYNEEEEEETEEAVITAAVKKLSLLESIYEEEYDDESEINLSKSKVADESKHRKRSSKSLLRDLTNCDDFIMRTSPPDLGESFGLPLLTLSNQITCSTPRNIELFTDEYSELKNLKSNDGSDESSIANVRPRRSCKPINLQEKSLRVKLRNDTATKLRTYSKSLTRRKTKSASS